MTEEKIRILIARGVTGFEHCYKDGCFYRVFPFSGECPQPFNHVDGRLGWLVRVKIPNYCADLNACADFERTLNSTELTLYHGRIPEIVLRDWRASPVDQPRGFSYPQSATALQRCEAYLRVKGLWVEGGAKS